MPADYRAAPCDCHPLPCWCSPPAQRTPGCQAMAFLSRQRVKESGGCKGEKTIREGEAGTPGISGWVQGGPPARPQCPSVRASEVGTPQAKQATGWWHGEQREGRAPPQGWPVKLRIVTSISVCVAARNPASAAAQHARPPAVVGEWRGEGGRVMALDASTPPTKVASNERSVMRCPLTVLVSLQLRLIRQVLASNWLLPAVTGRTSGYAQ